MAIIIQTEDSKQLLDAISQEVALGEIETWEQDADGDFTHTPEQFARKAWFRARVAEGRLIFNIIGRKGNKLEYSIYGIYHGRFSEMLISHFSHKIQKITLTPKPTSNDQVVMEDLDW
ncbi:MAG: hypothetical protein IPO40_23680 [Fibrobacteres bacterium]|nr:hypothetical protein [Fibrobacterota bacterium]